MIKYKKSHRFIATFFLLIFFPTIFPANLFASNNGPKSPEAASFEPIDSTDMVNLATGDMSYVLPLLNVPSPEGGYPLALSYHGGIAYDMESSWVGLGWNLNPGAIERGVNGYPDDWKESLVRTRNYYDFTATTLDVGVSVGIEDAASIDIGITYGWDSNGGNYGTVNLGASVGEGSKVSGNVSVGYHNKNGMIVNIGAGYKDKSGAMVGGSVGTDGADVGVGYTFAMGEDSPLNSTLGISLSSNGIGGSYSLSAGAGRSTFSISSGSLGETTETNMSIAIPIAPGAWLTFGKRKIKYVKDETYANFVNGPLYFKDFNYNLGTGSSYSSSLGSEVNRDYFMDVYEQRLPETETELVSYEDVYASQKYAFTFPSYDNYIVNAQGLAGSMTPRLFENGTLIGKSQNFEKEDNEKNIPGTSQNWGTVLNGGTLVPPVPGYNGGIIHFGVPVPFKYRTTESFLMNWNYDANFRKFSNSFGLNTNQNDANQVRFYFENSFPSNLKVQSSTITPSAGNSLINYIGGTNNKVNNGQRIQNANYVETYTNQQLLGNVGVLKPLNGDQIYDRLSESGYSPDGIGAYKITTPDGKTYHYAMPVYQYEEVYRQLKNNPDSPGNFKPENCFYHEQRKIQPYATHWVLTAVTGPDFYDENGNGVADANDYGYWVRFDYGKWTDGYCWRAPFKGFNDFDNYANYDSKENAREYGWGRKQLTYLNKVVTRSHTALMVKSLRYDSNSKVIGNENFEGCIDPTNPITTGYPSYEGDNGVFYPSQRTMKLDEIILVQNKYDNVYSSSQIENITTNASQQITVNWNSAIVKNPTANTNKVRYKINQQSLVLDKGDLPKDSNGNYLIYQNADKIIKLNQDYSLATNTPHSDAPAQNGNAAKGRLTLKSIKTLGRNGYDYMPPTSFDYFSNNVAYQECPNATCNIKNPWGYHDTNPQIWSLQKITTPTGAKLEFELEKDTYWTEAFSRRYWEADLMFKGSAIGNDLIIEVKNKTQQSSATNVDFTEYFMPNEKVFLDLLIWKRNRWRSGILQENREGRWMLDVSSDRDCKVLNVTNNKLTILSKNNANLILSEISCIEGSNDCYFARGSNPIIGSHVFEPQNPREEGRPDTPPGGVGTDASHHRMYYNLLANRIPGMGTGGGLRVKTITSIDESNNRYGVEYNYNDPVKNRTSGITSFAPVRGLKYIPYQAELPSPRVMYEYVTVTERGNTNNPLIRNNGKTVYQFNVLVNADNIFDKNIQVGDYFKSEVIVNDNLNTQKKLKSAKINIHDNTSQLGSIVSVSKYNSENQLLSKTYTKRKTLNELIQSTANNTSKGAVEESFQSVKSIHQFNSDYVKTTAGLSALLVNYTTTQKAYVNSYLTPYNRFLNVSTKTIYTPYVDYTEEIDATGNRTKTWSENQDPVNGLFNTTYTTKSDGSLIRNEVVPAYKKYGGTGGSMDSKVIDINNKNMLTQEAMSVTSVLKNGSWNATNANISTWSNNWTYRDNLGSEFTPSLTREKIWRKSKSFILKNEFVIANQLDYGGLSNSNIGFDWNTGASISPRWKKVSEITRYNHFSLPIESKDINNNFASSKMADNNNKIIVSGNARYTEMYYSGAEYLASGNYFEGEVQGANYVSDDVAHTGDFSVKVQSPQEKAFEVNGTSGSVNYYQNPDNYSSTFRPGKYKVSVWALENNSSTSTQNANLDNGTDLLLNNQVIPVSEVVMAGCWKQFNYYIDIPANFNNSIYIKNNDASSANIVYYDDFRLHPISSSINSYVYDHKTDQLSYTLDSNNMASAYLYDDAGRLKATYVETENHPDLDGGLKITSQVKQKYKSSNELSTNSPSTINNCLSISYDKMNIDIKDECIATFENKFRTIVTGGSGNFSYQYKWLLNDSTGQYSNWITSSTTQLIPYVPQMCDELAYNKKWDFVVKVTDNITGETLERDYSYSTDGCQFEIRNWADLQITKCNTYCGNEKFSFKVHLKDISTPGNFIYEYAYYNPSLPFNSQNFINVTNSNGNFCPNWSMVADPNCPSGYRDYVYLAFKVTNQTTGDVSNGIVMFMGDCTPTDIANPLRTLSALGQKYLEEGSIILLNERGEVEQISNVNNVVK